MSEHYGSGKWALGDPSDVRIKVVEGLFNTVVHAWRDDPLVKEATALEMLSVISLLAARVMEPLEQPAAREMLSDMIDNALKVET